MENSTFDQELDAVARLAHAALQENYGLGSRLPATQVVAHTSSVLDLLELKKTYSSGNVIMAMTKIGLVKPAGREWYQV